MLPFRDLQPVFAKVPAAASAERLVIVAVAVAHWRIRVVLSKLRNVRPVSFNTLPVAAMRFAFRAREFACAAPSRREKRQYQLLQQGTRRGDLALGSARRTGGLLDSLEEG